MSVLLPRSYAVEAHVPAGVQVAAEVLRHVEPDSELLAQRLYATCAELDLPTLQAEVAKVRGPCWCLLWCVCGVVPAYTRGHHTRSCVLLGAFVCGTPAGARCGQPQHARTTTGATPCTCDGRGALWEVLSS